jgi:hypothetical protein
MTILLISVIWLAALAALVLRLASRRPERAPASRERSPRLLEDAPVDFQQEIGAALASESATAKDVRDRAKKNLYVRP